MESIFTRYAPNKLSKIDSLFAKWEGREEELADAVERKYSFGRYYRPHSDVSLYALHWSINCAIDLLCVAD